MWVSGASWAELQAVWRSGWLFDCLMTMWALHLAAFRLRLWRTADIKCLMLACSTDVQIKSSPVRHYFLSPHPTPSFFPAFWQYICCFCCFFLPDSIQVLPFPISVKVCIVLSLLFLPNPPHPISPLLPSFLFLCKKANRKQKFYSGLHLKNCFPLEHLLVFNRGCIGHDAIMPERGGGAGRGDAGQYES